MAQPAATTPEPPESLLLVDLLYRAFHRRDLHGVGALLDPLVEVGWHELAGLERLRGREEVLRALAGAIRDSGGTATASAIAISADVNGVVTVVHQESGRWNRGDHDRCAKVTFESASGLITRVTRTPLDDGSDPVVARPLRNR